MGRHAMPERPEGAPLRDGDVYPYPGYGTWSQRVVAAQPTWTGPTVALPLLAAGSPLVRPFVRHRPR